MFSWLYNILGTMLSFFSKITGGSYALALLIYALVFKIVFLPFSIKQQKNQIKLAKLTPKIQLIKAKYKGRTDRASMQKQQQEIMELQQKEGYSALSGCLPLLLQMPLIIFLNNVIRNPLTYIAKIGNDVVVKINAMLNHPETEVAFNKIDQIKLIGQMSEQGYIFQETGLTAEQFSKIPDFTLFGKSLAETPSFVNFSWVIIIPFVAALSQWFVMWITRKVNGQPGQLQGEDQQSKGSMLILDLMMPAMTLFFAFSFSGMLGLYWIYQSILSVLQTVIIAKAMPMPKYTEEEIKQMRKAEKEAEKAQKAVLKSQPKYRSLHYIDEDDYDELPVVKSNNKNSNNKNISSGDRPEIKD